MIKISIKNIDKEFSRISKERNTARLKQHKLIADKLFNELITKTPIDTGFARNSWNMEYSIKSINLINTAPYIDYLNQGSSKQAPAYFIESTAIKYGKPLGTIVQNKAS